MNRVVYKIWDKKDKKYCVAYSRAYHDEEEWHSEESARTSLFSGEYKDTTRYDCHKFTVIYKKEQS